MTLGQRSHWPVPGCNSHDDRGCYARRHIQSTARVNTSGHSEAYRYLPDSVSEFPDQDGLAGLLEKAGFESVTYHNFTGGVAALHTAARPARTSKVLTDTVAESLSERTGQSTARTFTA